MRGDSSSPQTPSFGRASEELRADRRDRPDGWLPAPSAQSSLNCVWTPDARGNTMRGNYFPSSLLLPILMRGAASEHSKVRSAACDSLIQIVTCSGGMKKGVLDLLPAKARKILSRLAEGTGERPAVALGASPCEEDLLTKDSLSAADERTGQFICVSQLTPMFWDS